MATNGDAEQLLAAALRAQAAREARSGAEPAQGNKSADQDKATDKLSTGWILLLAALIGLAAGVLVGLVTLF